MFRIPALAPLLVVLSAPASFAQSPKIRTLTEQEAVDMMVGSSIQSSRSSNSAQLIARVREAFRQGKRFTLIAPEDVPAGWTTVVPSPIGGGGAWEYVRERTEKQGLATVDNAMLAGIRALEHHLGRKFDAVLRSEAAGATLTAFLMASDLGVPVVDACMTGRAVPEMQQSVPYINGFFGAPAAMVSRWGDTVILDRAVDDYRLEDLARAVAVASGGGVQLAGNVLQGRDLSRATITGAITEAILFGRTVREAAARGEDPVAALVKVANGFMLFRGRVTKADAKGERGFTWLDVELTGTGGYSGHTYKVFVKNENIVSWLDGRPDVMSPDLICNLHPKTGDTVFAQGLGAYPTDREIAMIAIPSSPKWRTARGVEVLGPRHFGFDFDYVPLEQLQKNRATLANR